MAIQEKLNFLVENKDTKEVKYPHVYKLFHDIETDQENEVFNIWMKKIAEKIDIRIKYIREYCEKEGCDFMIALFTVYKKLKAKPYLCHCYTDSWFLKNYSFNNKPIPEYEYYNYTSLYSLFWGYRSFPLDSNLDEENKRYKACLIQMFEVLDSSSNSFNSIDAIRNGFYDFDDTPVKEIQKNDFDCAYLDRFISSNEPTKTQEVVSDDRINSETNNKQVNKQKKEPPKVEIDVEACVGSYDEKQTEKLYGECNNVVFKYCKFEDFVNSLNNPNECNLVVKNKNLLYVLYKFFDDIFGSEAEYRIDQLNEKFSIPKERYSKKNSSYDNYTSKQKEFYDILVEI